MNPIQFAQQIKFELERMLWPAAPVPGPIQVAAGKAVFGTHGSVAVFAGSPTPEQIPPGLPMALVQIEGGDMDAEDPEIIMQRFAVVVGAEVAGDRMGEHAIIGGAARDLNRSAGRGTGEIMARVRAAVGSLTGADGCRVLLASTGTGEVQPMGNGRHIALERLELSAYCTSEPSFVAPQRLRRGFLQWEWDGEHCSSRFDFLRYRLVRRSGQQPSRTPTDGSTVYLGTEPRWTGGGSSGSTYTIFAEFNSRGGELAEGHSEPEVGSFRVL